MRANSSPSMRAFVSIPTRKTSLGDLTTGFEVQYEKTTVDSGNGIATLIEGIVTLAGFKGGYTDSQMNFWSGDFQFSAAAPQRTVGLAGYEFKLNDAWTFTLAYETGLPTSQAGQSDFVTVYPKDPVASAKLYYEKDDAEFQLAGMVHDLHIDGTHPRLAAFGRPQSFDAFGWATTAGLTLPVKWGADGSAFSMQATYAVNASPYLGTVADLSTLAGLVGVPVTTKGWSIVGSYHHVFSDHWEANAMASYLALDIAMDRQSPSIRTNRYAANLIYKPDDKLKLGAEVGYAESRYRQRRAAWAARPWPVQSGVLQRSAGRLDRVGGQCQSAVAGREYRTEGREGERACRLSVRDLEFLKVRNFRAGAWLGAQATAAVFSFGATSGSVSQMTRLRPVRLAA